jgi:hypothetical protein
MCSFATLYSLEAEYGVKSYVTPDQLEELLKIFQPGPLKR